jgi:hypothetical protein
MLASALEEVDFMGDEAGADIGVGVVGVHVLWFLAFIWGLDDPNWVQGFIGLCAVVVTGLLWWNARKIDAATRYQWVKLLAAWAVFALLTVAGLTAILYPNIETVNMETMLGYRALGLFWAGSAFSVMAVGAAHLGYVAREGFRGGRSTEEIHEDVLDGEGEGEGEG